MRVQPPVTIHTTVWYNPDMVSAYFMIPGVIGMILFAIAGILTGSFIIETIFQIPGLGREFVNSAANRDYELIAGLVVLYATLMVVMNLLVDIVQVWLNPKLRFE